MSFEVPKAHVQAYGSNVEHLSQQKGSRLRNTVTVSTGLPGTRYNFDQIGKVTAQVRSTRHGDSPLISTPHARRIIDLVDYEWGDLVDNEDMIRTLYDPTNPYTQAAIYAMGRAMDSAIITAFDATATVGVTDFNSTTTEAHPAAAQVEAGADTGGSTGDPVDIADLIACRSVLRANEHINDNEPVFCVCSSAMIDDLLAASEVQSIDQNTYRALAGGEVTSFMGFTFIQTELVGGIGTTTEFAYFYPRSAVRLGIGADITSMVERRPDKSFAWYPYVRMSIGATRTQASNVVRLQHDGAD